MVCTHCQNTQCFIRHILVPACAHRYKDIKLVQASPKTTTTYFTLKVSKLDHVPVDIYSQRTYIVQNVPPQDLH